MVFSSSIFLFAFLPLVLLFHTLAPKAARNTILLFSSLVFYAWGEGFFVFALLASVGLNYLCGLVLEKALKWQKAVLFFGVFCNILLLFVYKYLGFFASVIARVSVFFDGQFFGGARDSFTEFALPIGISFFTFQALSYLVDVYRGDAAAEKNPVRLALYISLFPQLIAGPIVRYTSIAKELQTRRLDPRSMHEGICRFVQGLGKKVLLADPLALLADTAFSLPADERTVGVAWLGICAYSLQIYLDFSGYSDMAIGLGRMLGFHFLENFNFPYVATSMKEFWRRWHISLSTWFRDYLYFPLGGNRKGRLRTAFNLCLVFLLCGLWHGASWSFILWGLAHGGMLALERLPWFKDRRNSSVLPHFYVLSFVLFSWVLFRANDLPAAVDYYSSLLGIQDSSQAIQFAGDLLTRKNLIVFALATLASFWPFFSNQLPKQFVFQPASPRPAAYALSLLHLPVLFVCFLEIAAGSYSPFIYFRF